jgi:hypothetical protein
MLLARLDEWARGYDRLGRAGAIRVLLERGLSAKAVAEVVDPKAWPAVARRKGADPTGRWRHQRKPAVKPPAARKPPKAPEPPSTYGPGRRVGRLTKSQIHAAVERAEARSRTGSINGSHR